MSRNLHYAAAPRGRCQSLPKVRFGMWCVRCHRFMSQVWHVVRQMSQVYVTGLACGASDVIGLCHRFGMWCVRCHRFMSQVWHVVRQMSQVWHVVRQMSQVWHVVCQMSQVWHVSMASVRQMSQVWHVPMASIDMPQVFVTHATMLRDTSGFQWHMPKTCDISMNYVLCHIVTLRVAPSVVTDTCP